MKEIGIRLNFTSSGEQKVIKNLKDLEIELAKLQTEIKSYDFGSAKYLEAAQNIQILRSRVDEFDKATEGIGAEKRFRAIGDAVSIATGSFQVLTGILGLVITQEEDLEKVQRAEAAALQVLNIALGINAINTALVESATLRATIATQASNAITKTATIVQQGFNAALKANPIGLIITGILALTGVVVGLVKVYDEFISSSKTYTDELDTNIKLTTEQTKNIGSQVSKLKILEGIVKDETRSQKERKIALEELKEILPELEKLTLNQADAIDKVAIAVGREISAIKERARVSALEEQLTAAIAEQLDIEQQLNAASEGTITSLAEVRTALLLNENAYSNSSFELQTLIKRFTESERKIDKFSQEIQGSSQALNVLSKEGKGAASSVSKTIEIVDEYTKSLEKNTAALQNYIEELGDLSEAEFTTDAKIIEKQKEIIDRQKSFLETLRGSLTPVREKLEEEFRDLFLTIIPTEAEQEEVIDELALFVKRIREKDDLLVFNFDKMTYEYQFDFTAERIRNLPGFKNFSQELQKSLIEYFGGIETRVFAINKILESSGSKRKADTEDLIALEDKISISRSEQVKDGRTATQQKEDELRIITEGLGLTQAISDNEARIQIERANFAKATTDTQKKQFTERIEGLEQEKKLIKEGADAILVSVINTSNFIDELAKVRTENQSLNIAIRDNKKAIEETFSPDALFQYFSGLESGFDVVITQVASNFDALYERFGEDGIEAILSGIGAGIENFEFETKEQVDELIKLLEDVGTKIAAAFGGENPFQPLIDGLKKVRQATQKELTGIQKFLTEEFLNGLSRKDIADKVLEAYSDISSRLAKIIQTNNSLILEQLQSEEISSLAAIGDANDRALELREAATKDFAERRFEIEKKARIQELQFSVAQAIADAAQSVLNALANIPAPFGAIYASGLGLITGAQVLAIRNQLTFAKSQQFIGRRGGLISGQSHEGSMGGVPAMLEGGEFVVNRAAVDRYGDLIGDLNSSTGGRKLSIDDSRLVQAISSQNNTSTPIKTYVLYNDIQNTQKLNAKITQLARL